MVFLCVTARCILQAARILTRQTDSFPVGMFYETEAWPREELECCCMYTAPVFCVFPTPLPPRRPNPLLHKRRPTSVVLAASQEKSFSSLPPSPLCHPRQRREREKEEEGWGGGRGESDPQSATAKEVGEGWVTNLTISKRIFQAQGWRLSLEHF